jgi:hypothetical protein
MERMRSYKADSTLPYDIARCAGVGKDACTYCRRREPGREEYQVCISPAWDGGHCPNMIPDLREE